MIPVTFLTLNNIIIIILATVLIIIVIYNNIKIHMISKFVYQEIIRLNKELN